MNDFLKGMPGDRDRRRDEKFVQNVLARTSGGACAKALGLLPDLTDHRLEDLDRQLVQAHLEHCAPCRQVAVTMGWLGHLLPTMAEVDPGPVFTAAVVARTSGALSPAEKAVRAGGNFGPAGLLDRLGRWWQRQLEKPQFALQFAYVATVLILALTATPWSPLKQAPGKALGLVQAGPQHIPLVSTVLDRGESGWQLVMGRVGGQMADGRRSLGRAWTMREERSRQARQATAAHLHSGWDHLGAGDLSEAGYDGLQAARTGAAAWKQWWRGTDSPDDADGNSHTAGKPSP